jgi:hypothetical protein
MDRAVPLEKWSPSCWLMLQGSRSSVATVSCSSLGCSKSPWRSYRCTTYSDGRRLLEVHLWSVWRSSTDLTIANRQVSDPIGTAEHIHREPFEESPDETDEVEGQEDEDDV